MPTNDRIAVERQKKSRVVATVRFDLLEVGTAEEQTLKHMGEHLDIKGFRKGNAPLDQIRARISAEDLFERTVRSLLSSTLPQLLKEHAIKPIAAPKVEVKSREPLTLSIIFVERPEVTVKHIDKLVGAKKEITVDTKEVERVHMGIRREHRTKKEVDRPAAQDDEVTIDFTAEDHEKKPIQGLRGSGETVLIGSKTLLPGFEDELIGLKKGEKKSFTVTLPEKFPVEQLRGKPATFFVTVQKVEEVTLPELTDALAKEQYGVATVHELKQKIEESIRAQEEQFQRFERERTLLDAIREHTQVDLADELIEQEVQDMLQEWQENLARKKTTIAEVLKKEGKTPQQAEEDLKKQAMERWKLRFGLQEIVRQKNITLQDEELQKAFQAYLQKVPQEEQSAVRREWDAKGTLFEEIKWRALVEKTIETLLA